MPTPQAAPAPQGAPTPQYSTQPFPGQQGQYYYAPQQRAPRSMAADVTITCILLTIGLFGMLTAVVTASALGPALQQEYSKYGLTFTGEARLPGLALTLILSHVVLFLIALGISIPLMVKKRIAFWVPLVGRSVRRDIDRGDGGVGGISPL